MIDDICESSFNLRVRFRRCQRVNRILPLLAVLSVLTNVYLVAIHHYHGRDTAQQQFSTISRSVRGVVREIQELYEVERDQLLGHHPPVKAEEAVRQKQEAPRRGVVVEEADKHGIQKNEGPIKKKNSPTAPRLKGTPSEGKGGVKETPKIVEESTQEEQVAEEVGQDDDGMSDDGAAQGEEVPLPSSPGLELPILKTTEEIMAEEVKAKESRIRHFRKKQGPRSVEPKEAALAPDATFSACLLIKDDNEILSEWIAYHYHTVGLRNLIVAIDPDSTESPLPILQRWKLLSDLDVVDWSDTDFMPDYFLENGHPPLEHLQKESDFAGIGPEGLLQISNHRYRQRVFLARCLRKFKEKGRTWVVHIDTDEYVVPSKLFRQVRTDYVQTEPMDQPGSVLHLLQETASKTPALINYPCISLMRLLFGSVESQDEARSIPVPDGFNSTSMESLRWRHHAPAHNMTYHGNPKVIIDVSAIPRTEFPHELVYSVHRPVKDYCHKNKELDYNEYHKQPIAANHYLGSYERYSGRSDNRRSRDIYNRKALVNDGTDDGTQLWLRGFVEHFGVDRAKTLLGDQYVSAAAVVETSTKTDATDLQKQ